MTRKIAATGHTWDNGTVTLSATCQRTGTRKYECTACGETKTETIAKRSHNYNIYLSRVEPTCTASGRTAGYECQWCYANTCSTIPALGHDLEYHDGQPATCTEIGWNDYETCSRCDYTTYREIAATGHTPGAAATCTTPQTCTECGAILVETLGHKTVSHLGQDPTCTAEGWKPYETCENCDCTTYETIPALGHSFTNYISDNNATCTEDGTETAKCDRCEVTDTRTDEGSALGHDWAEEWTTDETSHWHECIRCDEINDKASHSGGTATCTNPAECEVCGAEYGEALGHDLEHHEAKPATCTEIGWEAYDTCTRCDYTTYVEIPAKGHTFGPDATCTEDQVCLECGEVISAATGHIPGPDATCTENQTCSVCGEILTPALGHSFTSYISDNNATCTEDGTETAKCDRCEVTDTRTDEGSALGHDLEHHEAKPATCTEIGWNAYDTCTRCDYTTYVEIEALGHNWAEEWTTDGTAHWHECSRCDEINDKANHSGGEATCTNSAECEVCGVEYGSALGHTESEAVRENEVPASCTVAGSYDEVVYCSVCGEELSREEKVIDALGHSFTSYISDNNATCTEDGTETAKCDRCEVTDTRTDEGSALGHNWAEEWTTDGTAHWHKCSRCDEINDKANHSGGTATCIALAKCEICGVKYGDFAEHVYVENAEEQYLVSAATCTAKATYYKSCSVCGEAGKEIFEYGEPLGHEYGEPEWTWEGYTSATATFTCTRGCGDKQTITASGSSITNVVTTPAECETEGLRTYTAKVMFGGEEYVTTTTETIEALGHDLEHHEAQPATCIEIGWNAYDTCTRCDYTTYVEIEALGHDWAEEWTTDGTAHWHECSRCDAINDKANHSGGTATCTNPAECEVCGAAYGDALGHTESEAVRENEVPASCTAAGSYDEVVYCSVCGEELSREEKVIDALGHDLEHHEAKPATCTEIGWDAYDTCSRCDYTTYIEIEALGHTEGEAVRENEVPASCTAAGSYDEVVYCAVCGEELSRAGMTIEALGHDIVKHEGQAATCTQNGWNDYETCSRCDYTTYREIAATGHTPGTAATCTSAQRCTVCGTTLVPARGHHFVDGYCSVCGAIDGTALDNDKDDAKTDLDDIAQDAKDEIDGSDLPDDVKEDLKDKVDEIINGAKDEVEGSTDFDDIDQAVENTKDEIEDAILDAEKDDAKSDLDEIAQGAKDEVDGSDLPDDVKDDLKDKIDEIVNDAKTEIDGETSKEEVDQTVEDAQQEIEDAILNAEKDDAKSDLDKIAQSAKDEIGSSGISDEEKAELKDKVDAAIEDAKEAIDNATSKEEVENIVNDTREDIDDLLKGSLDNELAEKKDAAISDLTEIAQDAKDGIDGSDISDEEKDELKGKVDEIVNDAKDEIEGAVTPEEIDEILAEAENEIAAVTEDLKAGQLNTSTLWPWIIVAIVISAALSTLFAWRHVKKVQGKGEAVGAKSVVTIAVATILIFVVVIGITLLIFAMV